jgi:hypothetical protein
MQLAGTIAVFLSVLVLAYQTRKVAHQTRVANQVAGTEAHREVIFHWKRILDVFVEHPQLYPHFFGDDGTALSAADSVRLQVVAQQCGDWLETGLLTSHQLASYEAYTPVIGSWDDYVASMIIASRPLRSYIREHPHEWPRLTDLLDRHVSSQPGTSTS